MKPVKTNTTAARSVVAASAMTDVEKVSELSEWMMDQSDYEGYIPSEAREQALQMAIDFGRSTSEARALPSVVTKDSQAG